MNQFSVPMALVDFIPVILFAVSSIVLQRDLYNKMSKGAFALFAAGTIDIIAAGALKALYKLARIFFMLISPGQGRPCGEPGHPGAARPAPPH